MVKIKGIACVSSNGSIGNQKSLIFDIPDDLRFFSVTTKHTENNLHRNAILMGKNTFQSMKFRVLPKRLNCVISTEIYNSGFVQYLNNLTQDNSDNYKDVDVDHILQSVKFFKSIHECLNFLNSSLDIETLFVIGGEKIYDYFITRNLFDNIIITNITCPKIDYGDTFFPSFDTNHYNLTLIDSKENIYGKEIKTNNIHQVTYHIIDYQNRIDLINKFSKYDINCCNKDEYQYLNLIKNVLENGDKRKTRNAEVLSLFSIKMDFDIEHCIPLLTTKKVYFKGVLKELIWFLNGNTDAKLLQNDKVHIWDGNSSREYLDSVGLNSYPEGDCGPIYGYQWRSFNKPYKKNTEFQGIDQLKNIIHLINTNPMSRRMIMTAWNPCQLDEMVLPPCHVSYQFYVTFCKDTGEKMLHCLMYQRSGDLFLGVPFNIASTALLTYIISNITNCKPKSISIILGDAHLYLDHIDAVKTQLNRIPYPFPKLKIDNKYKLLEEVKYEDFHVLDYISHEKISAKMIA